MPGSNGNGKKKRGAVHAGRRPFPSQAARGNRGGSPRDVEIIGPLGGRGNRNQVLSIESSRFVAAPVPG